MLSLGVACGLKSANPIRKALEENNILIRKPGSVPGKQRVKRRKYYILKCSGNDCGNEFTTFPSSNKRFCSPRCRYTSVEMANLLRGNYEIRHSLSEINETSRTAVCANCGVTDIRSRVSSGRYKNSVAWRCRAAERIRDWAKKYGIGFTEVQNMLIDQNRSCAICMCEFSDFKKMRVDHSHSSGKVRGLLCNNCNWGLGHFSDDAGRLKSAIEYLERSGM